MNWRTLLACGATATALVGCQSGDINIDPATNVSNSNNTTNAGGGGANDVCASYVNASGQKIQGTYDGTNCTYSPSFVDAGKNLLVDMTIPALPNGGAHVFQGSLFVGRDYSTDAELAAAGIAEGGDGPTLTVEAGATLAFTSEKQFIIINRGSQIFAVGRSDAPITFTSVSDVNGTVGPEDVQQWGGLVINGFGITNACAYTGSVATNDLATTECHVLAEGAAGLDESHYGGDNNDDSSGRLEYVIAKHTGATVGNGDELNGISWGAVGRNTIVNNIEMYSTYDDGLEFFGGAVNINNYLAVYVRDDSIDIDEGYSGTITNALVIQSATDGNSCIEADGIADFGNLTGPQVEAVIAQGINSRPTIDHLTCIISPDFPGTHEPGNGWHLREGIFPTISNALVIGSFAANDQTTANDNYCLRIDNRTQQAALDGEVHLNSVIFACAEQTRGQTFPDGTTTELSFAQAQGNVFATIPNNTAVNATATANPELQLLEGSPPIFSIPFATSMVDGAVPANNAPPAGSAPTSGTYLGGVLLGNDWTSPWAYGIDPANRGEALWFE
jgi:hypothetical protein